MKLLGVSFNFMVGSDQLFKIECKNVIFLRPGHVNFDFTVVFA
jgi:hypothetical protein